MFVKKGGEKQEAYANVWPIAIVKSSQVHVAILIIGVQCC